MVKLKKNAQTHTLDRMKTLFYHNFNTKDRDSFLSSLHLHSKK